MLRSLMLAGIACCVSLLADTCGADQSGDFWYASDGTNVTITNYTGSGGAVTIPDMISGLPVSVVGVG